MAGSATVNTGNTNRRFILLALVLGLLGAILVYATFSRESSSEPTASTGVLADTPVVVARNDIPARTVITASMLEVRLVPADSRTDLAYADTSAVIGQATRFPIAANEQILPSKVVPLDGTLGTGRSLSFTVPQGMRGIAINASEVQNAGGLVLPGDYIDILVVYDMEFPTGADPTERETVDAYFVHTLMQNVEVLSVSPDSCRHGSGSRANRRWPAHPQQRGATDPGRGHGHTVCLSGTGATPVPSREQRPDPSVGSRLRRRGRTADRLLDRA